MVRVSALIGAVALATAATAAAVESKASTTSRAAPLPTVDLGYGLWSATINVSYFSPLPTARGSLGLFYRRETFAASGFKSHGLCIASATYSS